MAEEEIQGQGQGRVCQCEEDDQGAAQQGDQVDAEPPQSRGLRREPKPENPSKTNSVTAVPLPPSLCPQGQTGRRTQERALAANEQEHPTYQEWGEGAPGLLAICSQKTLQDGKKVNWGS